MIGYKFYNYIIFELVMKWLVTYDEVIGFEEIS